MSIVELGSEEAVRQYVMEHAEKEVIKQESIKEVRILPGCVVVIPGVVKAHYTSSYTLESSLRSFVHNGDIRELLFCADYLALGDDITAEGLTIEQELLRTIEYLAKENTKKWGVNDGFFHVVSDNVLEEYPLLMEVIEIVDSLVHDPVDGEVYVDYCGCPWWYSACEDSEAAWDIFEKTKEAFREVILEKATE